MRVLPQRPWSAVELSGPAQCRPSADIGTVQSILSLDRAKVGLIGSWAKAYDHLDAAAIRRLQIQIGVATAKTRRAARAYGFEVCGQG